MNRPQVSPPCLSRAFSARLASLTLTTLAILTTCAPASPATIVCSSEAPPQVRLAAKEVRRYLYLRTGQLPTMATSGAGLSLRVDPSLAAEAYRIAGDSIAGGSDLGVLYGAYRYAEHLGVRFYLHGDVLPDQPLDELPNVTDAGEPRFALRGVNPWGSHPFGFDAWSADDYRALAAQLAKMRMNFLGIHCYPEGHPYAEPTVWHGLSDDFDAAGRVRHSYVSRYFNTLLTPGWGDYRPKKTSDYGFGGALLFEDEAWAPWVLRGHCPLPATLEDCNEVFNRMGAQFKDAFTFARQLGVKTCIGTEAPLTVPQTLRRRLESRGADPDSPAVRREVYEGTFRRIMASHPLDYYWIWTPEGWTWEGNQPAQYSNTVADIKLALEAIENVRAPFRLATAGWVLGPAHDRAAFDQDLPKTIPMSAISRDLGAVEVDPAFGRIRGRDRWAIPWLESDARQGLAGLQLWVGRLRRDARDALDYGCTGLMGLHWRTDILAPNASALAQAAWENVGTDPRSAEISPPEPSSGADNRNAHRERTELWRIPGQIARYPDASISGTEDAPLYRSCRYDLGLIQLPVPAGTYRVTLKFCEPHFHASGQRICDVIVQGRPVLTELDIFARAGAFAALDYSFDDIAVTNGTLSLELVPRQSLPCIAAIAVENAAFTRKVNCGGEAYQDWEADVGVTRSLPCEDFYADWAKANFGLAEAGAVFAALDGRTPQVTDGGCPSGSLTAVKSAWSEVAPQFRFVDEFERLRPRIEGAGNRDRFDYWAHTFAYLRSLARLRCALTDPHPEELRALFADAYRHLLATVNSPGGLAMVVNMENHPGWGMAISQHAPPPWPKDYQGQPRLVVPTARSVVSRGETLVLKIIALDRQPMKSVEIRMRPLGHGEWRVLPASHVAQAVHERRLPPASEDFEYSITAETDSGVRLVWPPTAPRLNQTVVVLDGP